MLTAVQSRVNGGLSGLLGNGVEAALFSFGTGLAVLWIVVLFAPSWRLAVARVRSAIGNGNLPWWQVFAGAGGAMFVIIQSYSVPRIGVAVFSVAYIAGLTGTSLIVDALGVRNGVRHHITRRRFLTAVITTIAVIVSVWDRLALSSATLLVPLLGMIAGAIVAFQRAFNAHITDYSRNGYATTFLNFNVGMVLLVVVGLGMHSFSFGPAFVAPSGASWWMFTGGVVGALYVAFAAMTVQRIGVLMTTVLSVGGQLLGSLAFDIFMPTAGVTVAANVYLGILISMFGIIVGGIRLHRPAVNAIKEQQ